MKVRFEIFRSSTKSWLSLFEEAAQFASKMGEQRVINISHSCDHSTGVVTVWYWAK